MPCLAFWLDFFFCQVLSSSIESLPGDDQVAIGVKERGQTSAVTAADIEVVHPVSLSTITIVSVMMLTISFSLMSNLSLPMMVRYLMI